eukprot:TRINITY_DN8770_c0_g1_i1.p1 TRINITY_DN8770_c0_g1~~TRINITY_DN8770_c0_g1_i1.p1  ORF type:complete len:901 (+),score=162.59 TRINITY_DN8770_c0_g1_i1:12-2714(+)
MIPYKKFNFFDKQTIEEGESDLDNIDVVCATSGRGYLVFGDVLGNVHIVDSDIRITKSFAAYYREIKLCAQVKSFNYLVTVGDDQDFIAPTVKIWDMDLIDPDGYPLLYNPIELPTTFPVTYLAVSPDFTQIAIGICDGTVYIITGDPVKRKWYLSRNIKILDTDVSPVTGLGFTFDDLGNTILFVTTYDSISTFYSNRNETIEIEDIRDQTDGCISNCATITEKGELVIGRKEGYYYYTLNGKESCKPFNSERKLSLMSTYRDYIIVVDQASNLKYNTVTLYENENQFVAYTGPFRAQNITILLIEWNEIIIVSGEGKVYKLVEKDLQAKLDILFRRHLYDLAINLAKSNQYDSGSIIDICRKFGDHLYKIGDYDKAILQYINTIVPDDGEDSDSKLEASYVIKKFLDAERIHNLTLYLQALHEARAAKKNHTTLLLNCYTKLKDHEKLDKFIKTPDLSFDVETAIKVCRQGNYHDHALDLAFRNKEHKWYLKILLEDLNDHMNALTYIKELDFESAKDNMKKYGKRLMSSLPVETTEFLMILCTDFRNEAENPGTSNKASAEDFIHIFVNAPLHLVEFLEFVTNKGEGTILSTNTLLELYLREHEIDSNEREIKILNLLQNCEYDEGHALFLCQMNDFKPGVLFLFEKLKLYNEILQYYMDSHDYGNIIISCKKYGKIDPNLWVKALTFFSETDPVQCKNEITQILKSIDDERLLPPLQIIQLLSQSPNATLGMIKPYISKHLKREQKHVSDNYQKTKRHVEEIEKNKKEIDSLTSGAKVFQHLKCERCKQSLMPPAVHFLCNHSFHSHCLGDNEHECPECEIDNATFQNRQRSLNENSRNHGEFFRQLDTSYDGFSVVAQYFGRGMFDQKKSSYPIMDGEIAALDPRILEDIGIIDL